MLVMKVKRVLFINPCAMSGREQEGFLNKSIIKRVPEFQAPICPHPLKSDTA